MFKLNFINTSLNQKVCSKLKFDKKKQINLLYYDLYLNILCLKVCWWNKSYLNNIN